MMKKALALSLLTAVSINVLAEDLEYQSWVGGFAEYYNPDSDKPDPMGYLDSGYGLGAEFGYRIDPNWAVRLEWSQVDLDTDYNRLGARTPNNAGARIGVDAMYFTPADFYLFGGIKNLNIGDSHRLANVGLGKHWEVKENLRVITEAAVYHDFGESFRDYGLKVGLAYTFGGNVSAGPRDDDRDGVYNAQDRCPNTSFGTAVDQYGCDNDSDNDGVINSQDKCPDTPAGTAVDAKGCNRDEDGDGVLNDQDRCPNTPAGTKVGVRGCNLATDSDQDGVLDQNDQCPDTPLTDKVDKVGCSIFIEELVKQSLHVLFDNNSDEINNPQAEQFQAFADFMNRFPNTEAVIEGHTSAVGDADYNQGLSERRANAVVSLLTDVYGLSENRLTAVGYGESQLLDEADTAEAHRINRRIDAVVTAMQKVKATKE